MNPKEIIDFFNTNPNFFEEHPDLVEHLLIPHPTNGNTISLSERQILTLREKLSQVQSKLAELVSFGEENDVITEKMHRLTLSLMLANDFESVNFSIYNHLQEDFSVPHVALRIWNSVLKREAPEFGNVSEELRFFAADLKQPYCGPTGHQEILNWFSDAAPHLASLSLIPLKRDAQIFGMLALGSEDPERFFPEMGTLYVERIGELVSAALLKQLG